MKNHINALDFQNLNGAPLYEFALVGAQYIHMHLKSEGNVTLIGSDVEGVEHILGQGTEINLRTRLTNFTHLVIKPEGELPITAQLHLVPAGNDKQDYTPAIIQTPRTVETLETQIRRGIEKVLRGAGVYDQVIEDANEFEDGDMGFESGDDFMDRDTPFMEREVPFDDPVPAPEPTPEVDAGSFRQEPIEQTAGATAPAPAAPAAEPLLPTGSHPHAQLAAQPAPQK